MRRSLVAAALAAAGLATAIAIAGPPPAEGVRVKVFGPDDIEVPGAEVYLSEANGWKLAGTTGPDGTLILPGIAADGKRRLAASFEWKRLTSRELAALDGPSISGDTATLRVPFALHVTPEFVDGQTGAPVPGVTWRPPLVSAHSAPRTGPAVLPYGFGGALYFGMTVDVPKGWLAYEPVGSDDLKYADGYTNWIAPGVGRARVVYPLRRQALVRVSFATKDGREQPIDRLVWRFSPDGAPTELRGDWRGVPRSAPSTIGGIPWFPGAEIELRVAGETRESEPREFGGIARVVLGPTPDETVSVQVQAREGLDTSYARASETEPKRPGYFYSRPESGGVIEAHVVRLNGKAVPKLDLRVASKETRFLEGTKQRVPKWQFELPIAAGGTGTAADVAPGEYTVSYDWSGLLPMDPKRVVVKEHETSVVTLTEPLGCALDVRIADSAGEPLPFARVKIDGPIGGMVIDVEDDVQRLDPFVGADGRRTYRGVMPGDLLVNATWGPRTGVARVKLKDGEGGAVTVTLVDPKDD